MKPCRHEAEQAGCRACHLYRIDPRYRALWGGPPARKAQAPCGHLGAPTGGTVRCPSCKGHVELKLFGCAVHGVCTQGKKAPGVACCLGCPDHDGWPRRFDEANLWPGTPGKRFNASILACGEGYLLAARHGWAGSEVYLGRLDKDFRPAGEPWQLELRHASAAYGREDPRLFWHQGRLHVAYVGVSGAKGKVSHTSMLYARLTPDFRVEEIFAPSNQRPWEKNWSFFSRMNRLHAVYTVRPHRVITLEGADRAESFGAPTIPWQGGEPRGGAPPVLVGGEYWHFFHDRVDGAGHKVYRTGLYTFDADPPFAPRRYIPEPILSADPSTKPGSQYAAVVFTCGAVLAGGHWILSSGVHDRWAELHRFRRDELEARLVPVPE